MSDSDKSSTFLYIFRRHVHGNSSGSEKMFRSLFVCYYSDLQGRISLEFLKETICLV